MDKISSNQKQTQNAFGFKWQKRDTYESDAMQSEWKRWLFEKYFDSDDTRLRDLLGADGGRKKILDAGCGSAGSGYLLFGDNLKEHDYLGVDISESVTVAAERFKELQIPAEFAQCDLSAIPEKFGLFDIIFSEGVLHHTNSVEDAILQLSTRLKEKGHFLFYVYAKKAPVREFTDDFIRDYLSHLDNEQAWEALMPLTKLGKTLGELDVEVEIDQDIPFLGIDKGKYDLQRLFFYKICKAYYRPEYSVDEMNHINFDWFRPLNCFRHTPEEIRTFCLNAGLTVKRLFVEDSGITVIARK